LILIFLILNLLKSFLKIHYHIIHQKFLTKHAENHVIKWNIDSTPFHMVNDLNLLTDVSKCSDKIYFANDQFVESTHIGTFVGYINGYKITFNNVYYRYLLEIYYLLINYQNKN